MYRADKLQCLLPDSDSTIALNWYHRCSNSIAKAKLKAMLQLKRQSENRESAGRAEADGEKLTLYYPDCSSNYYCMFKFQSIVTQLWRTQNLHCA